jgi:hypothetical protein
MGIYGFYENRNDKRSPSPKQGGVKKSRRNVYAHEKNIYRIFNLCQSKTVDAV